METGRNVCTASSKVPFARVHCGWVSCVVWPNQHLWMDLVVNAEYAPSVRLQCMRNILFVRAV